MLFIGILGLSIHYEMGSKTTLFGVISEQILLEKFKGNAELSDTCLIEDYLERKNNELVLFKENDLITIEGPFKICGYDPINMIGFEHQILHNHFVMLMKDKDIIFVQGPVLTTSNKESLFDVIKYTYKKPI